MKRIRIIGLVNGQSSDCDGHYIVSYDPTYVNPIHGYDGGQLITCEDPEQAAQFTTEEAIKLWKSVAPAPWHVRPDGKPNRPLTAFTVEIA